MRVLTTSGTTGTSKALPESIRQWEARNFLYSIGPMGEARSGAALSLFGLSAAGGYRFAFETLWSGGTFFLGWPARTFPQVIARNKIVRIYGSPAQYQGTLQSCEPEGYDLSSLRYLFIAGAMAPRPLITAIRTRICRSLINSYGSTEMGIVAFVPALAKDPPGTCGTLLPWVQAQAVDADGTVLPPGLEGILRFCSETMTTGYLNDPKASAQCFRDGWFYPGDVGIISAERRLTVTGRWTERINAGGLKTSPELVEDAVISFEGVVECAAFGVADKMGVEQIWTAIVADREIDFEQLRRHCAPKLGVRTPKKFLQLAKLPRNANGKVLRNELVEIASPQARA